jgi:hypothetical protein
MDRLPVTLFNRAEAARFIGVSEDLMQEWLDADLIPCIQVGDDYRIPMGGLQCVMGTLPGIDLEADLEALFAAGERYGIND